MRENDRGKERSITAMTAKHRAENINNDRPVQIPSWMNRTVAGAGITSALGDFCYETTTVILPGFLAVLSIPAAALGLIEGIADAVASFTKMVSGYIADKLGHRELLVLVGYGLAPVGQALIALALGWPLILLGRVLSWFGKGLRGPLRDAIVIQAVHPTTRGRAFGFHRAADTVGAVLGPLLGVVQAALEATVTADMVDAETLFAVLRSPSPLHPFTTSRPPRSATRTLHESRSCLSICATILYGRLTSVHPRGQWP